MNIWVDDQLFGAQTAHEVDRVALLRTAFLRRHTLVISDRPEFPSSEDQRPEFVGWRERLGDGVRFEIDLLLKGLETVPANTTTRGGGNLWITAEPARFEGIDVCVADLPTAIHLLGLPLAVLVEDVINERSFLLRVMPPRWRARLRQWEDLGQLCFEHGGGIDSMRRLVGAMGDSVPGEHFSSEHGPLTQAGWRLVHFLVFDHDGCTREEPSGPSKSLATLCGRVGLQQRYHRLERRDQESYLPKPALVQILGTKSLSAAQHRRFLEKLDRHFEASDRDFQQLPGLGKEPLFKNEFGASIAWQDGWFVDCFEETTRLAEAIASAM